MAADVGRKFHFIREIAAGGFGAVYLAKVVHADGFSRLVAVKLLHPKWSQDESIASRMRDEARLLGVLRHRNIVDVLDLTMIDGRVAVIMEYLEAVDARLILTNFRDRGLLIPIRVALELCAAVATALDAAYNRPPIAGEKPLRVIHRDIKPSNLMLDESGTPKVLDFGVARADFESRESKTEEMSFGSLEYMPPERLFFEPDSPSSDVYSLGATLYELIALEKFGKAKLRPHEHEGFIFERFERMLEVHPIEDADAAEELMILLKDMLAFEEGERPAAADAANRMRALSRRFQKQEGLAEWAERHVPPLVAEFFASNPNALTNPLVDRVLSEDPRGLSGGRHVPAATVTGEVPFGEIPTVYRGGPTPAEPAKGRSDPPKPRLAAEAAKPPGAAEPAKGASDPPKPRAVPEATKPPATAQPAKGASDPPKPRLAAEGASPLGSGAPLADPLEGRTAGGAPKVLRVAESPVEAPTVERPRLRGFTEDPAPPRAAAPPPPPTAHPKAPAGPAVSLGGPPKPPPELKKSAAAAPKAPPVAAPAADSIVPMPIEEPPPNGDDADSPTISRPLYRDEGDEDGETRAVRVPRAEADAPTQPPSGAKPGKAPPPRAIAPEHTTPGMAPPPLPTALLGSQSLPAAPGRTPPPPPPRTEPPKRVEAPPVVGMEMPANPLKQALPAPVHALPEAAPPRAALEALPPPPDPGRAPAAPPTRDGERASVVPAMLDIEVPPPKIDHEAVTVTQVPAAEPPRELPVAPEPEGSNLRGILILSLAVIVALGLIGVGVSSVVGVAAVGVVTTGGTTVSSAPPSAPPPSAPAPVAPKPPVASGPPSGPHVAFRSALADTKKLTARCDSGEGAGVDVAYVAGEKPGSCTVIAQDKNRKRVTAVVKGVEARAYVCFEGDSKECK